MTTTRICRHLLTAVLATSSLGGCATTSPATPPPAPTPSVAPTTAPAPVVAQPEATLVPLDEWSTRFPGASKALLAWTHRFPHASRRVLAWDEEHPEETKELVFWALAYPEKNFGAFADTHPKWDFVLEFSQAKNRPTIDAFLDFCQKHEAAVRALLDHPGGLACVVRLLHQK